LGFRLSSSLCSILSQRLREQTMKRRCCDSKLRLKFFLGFFFFGEDVVMELGCDF
jgi:hypothetical protein